MSECVVVIPVHSAQPTQNERLSFLRCFEVLKNHAIKIVAPKDLDLTQYRSLVDNFEVIFIDPVWQSSLEQYNKLKISHFFYSLFPEYNFLLTYELDSYVFEDDLTFWCNKNYDYIGAPWFSDPKISVERHLTGVGNSGFSLRNIKTAIKILRRIDRIKRTRHIWYASKMQSLIRFEKFITTKFFGFRISDPKQLSFLLFDNPVMHEDHFWSQIVASVFSDYKVAPIKDAMGFSFEEKPSLLYKMRNQTLPFGCHAWEKYEPLFWNKFIPLNNA